MNAVDNKVALREIAGGATNLSFVRLKLPHDMVQVRGLHPRLEPELHALLADAACAEDGQVSVFLGSGTEGSVLLAPCVEQAVELPIRLGEKVVCSQRLPGIRFTPAAQYGVTTEQDARSLLAWLRSSGTGRAVVLTDVSTDSPLYAAAVQARQLGYLLTKNEPAAHLFHRFGESYADFFNQRSSKYKNQLRKKEKVFAAQFGDAFEFREYRRPEDVLDFLSAAKEINRKTYQYRMFGESVDDDQHSAAAARRAAMAGCFRSFVLWHNDVPLCFILGHQRGDGKFEHRQTGFDPEYRDASPGIFSNILLLQRLYTVDTPRLMDFGSGDSDYKRLFSNESRTTASPVLLPRQFGFMLAFGVYEVTAAANSAVVKWLERFGIKDWLKRRLRRGGG